MNEDVFAEWFRRQGYPIFRTRSSYWFKITTGILQAFPYHHLICPDKGELDSLIHEKRILGLRYSRRWEDGQGAASYHVCFSGPEYEIESLHKKARYDVRRCLKKTKIEQISFSRLSKEGWELRLDTLRRQGRVEAESQRWWESLCLSAAGLPGIEAWAALVDGQMAASLLAIRCEDCWSILYQQSRSEYLPLGVNNALAFVFTREALARNPGSWFFYGLHSLDAPPTVDSFKFRMGYRAKPVRQQVVFHPLIAPFFNGFSHALLKRLHKKWPEQPSLAKAEGVVRFYRQGKKPIGSQDWPQPLQSNSRHHI
jgi:hypothetical protein